jgi:hypothetical protein
MQRDQKLIAEVLSRTDEAADKRKAYEPPLLQELGTISELTFNASVDLTIYKIARESETLLLEPSVLATYLAALP